MTENRMLLFVKEIRKLVDENVFVSKESKESIVKDLLSLDFTDNESKTIEATYKMLDCQSKMLNLENEFYDQYGHYPENGEFDALREMFGYQEEKAKLEMLARKRATWIFKLQ